MSAEIQKLYIAYFNRPADPGGLAYWTDQLAKGATMTQIANSFSASAEYQAIYAGKSNLVLIDQLYQNLFGRTADVGGLLFWSNEMLAGRVTITPVASALSSGTTAGSADNIAINSKIAAATAFTAAIDTAPELLAYSGSAATAKASAWLSTVTNAATLATAIAPATLNAAVADSVASGSASGGQTFTLTTGVDVSGTLVATGTGGTTSTSGNDTFNAIIGTGATLNSFDNINGGAGTDTLNIASNDAGAQTFPASTTYAGFETVNLSRTGAGTNTLTVTNSTFGSGVQNFSVTDAGNAIAGAYGITLASARSVSVVGTAVALGAITVTDTDATTTATQGSLLNSVTATKAASLAVNGNGVTTVNINAIAGTTTITSAAGTRALAINASGTTTQGALTDAEATSAVITVSGAQTLGLVTVAKATSVTINTNAAATTSIAAAVATTLNLGGTSLNTLTINAATVAATSVVITGAGGVAADLTPITALTSIDTTGSTAAVPASGVLTGANTLTIGVNVAFTGGAGQDVVSVAATARAISLGAGNDTANISVAALATGGSINGGDGTDELILTNANAVTLSTSGSAQTAFRTAVTGFETLNITAQTGSTVSVNGPGTFSTVKFTSAAAAQILSGVVSGQTINSVWGAAGTSVTTNSLTGPTDSLTISLTGDLTTAARSFGTFATPGVETVNFVTGDTSATVTARQALVTLTDASARNIVVSGNNGLQVIHTGTNLSSFDASGVTRGSVSFISAALDTDSTVRGTVAGGDYLNLQAATAKTTITSTAGANTLAGSSTLANTITGGSGADTIFGGAAADVINGGAGNDSIFASAVTAAGEVQTITFGDSGAAGTAANTVTIGGVVITIGQVNAANTTAAVVAAANTILAANPTMASIADNAGTTVITYKALTGDVAQVTATVVGAAAIITNAETTKGIVPGATGTLAAHAAADTLTGGAGNDTFFFRAGGAITAAATITDLNLGSNLVGGQVDQINIDGATTSAATAAVLVTLTAAQQTNVTNSVSLAAAVDAVLALAGTVNNIAQFTYGADTYFIHNGATANAAFTAGEDTLIKITGVAGTLDISDVTIV